MTKEARMTTFVLRHSSFFRHSCFVIRHSFDIRASSFVIYSHVLSLSGERLPRRVDEDAVQLAHFGRAGVLHHINGNQAAARVDRHVRGESAAMTKYPAPGAPAEAV